MPPDIGESIDLMLAEANDRLKELSGVEARAVYGLTGEELAAFGDEVDILVVGSRSYGPVRRLVLGSTSDYLERHARCSLLVLPRIAVSDGDGGRNGGKRDAGLCHDAGGLRTVGLGRDRNRSEGARAAVLLRAVVLPPDQLVHRDPAGDPVDAGDEGYAYEREAQDAHDEQHLDVRVR